MSESEKGCWARTKAFWLQIKAGIVIWICRILSFIWVYMYHDWQSVLILIWIVHSTLFRDSANFKKWMIYLYMPLVTCIFLWYYVINIYGLLLWWSDETKTIDMYRFGFYEMEIPPLETGFMFLAVYSFSHLTSELSSSENEEQFQNMLIS